MNKFARVALVASPLALLGNLSHAAAGAAVDVTDAVGTIGAQLTPVGLIGVAILGVVVAVAAFGWIRKGIH
ncbi:major capsid protein [Variovorax sp. GB1P17]|uniref:major capsid protein n=1 Tax=Variovorax sp. GB1P17 TaxID=3443740 RepID=UPI003F48E4D4